jgi:hypothetical protein
MKSRVTRILSIGIALAAVAAVHAQDKTVMANVPFHFYMGSSSMPQGSYRVSEFGHGVVVSMQSADAVKSATTHDVIGKKQVEPARLVFHRYGDAYFLAEIWTGDNSNGFALATSAREKELARGGTAPVLAEIRLALPR